MSGISFRLSILACTNIITERDTGRAGSGMPLPDKLIDGEQMRASGFDDHASNSFIVIDTLLFK